MSPRLVAFSLAIALAAPAVAGAKERAAHPAPSEDELGGSIKPAVLRSLPPPPAKPAPGQKPSAKGPAAGQSASPELKA